MNKLEHDFVAALDELAPSTADVAEPVLARLRAQSASPANRQRALGGRPDRQRTSRGIALAAAAVVFFLGVIFVVSPASEVVARWLGIGATEIVVVPEDSSPSADSPATVAPFEAPRASISFEGLTTTTLDPIPRLGPPIGILDVGVARSRSYVWLPDGGHAEIGATGLGVILTARSVDGDAALKRVGGGVGVEFVQIESDRGAVPALWIDGTHEYVADPSSAPVLAERVLVWEVDGVQYRIESSLDLDRVLDLAADVREGTDLLRPG